MAVTYQTTMRTRERILAFGAQGTGKSNAILTVAAKTPTAQFHVIDNDYSESYNRALDLEYQSCDNVIVHRTDPDNWAELRDTVADVVPQVGVDDWLVVDSMTPTWAAVQSWFISEVHGQDEDAYFMEVRKAKQAAKKDSKSLGALEGWMDWPVINRAYKRLYSMLQGCKGHLYMTAEMRSISEDDDKEVRGRFGPYGVKPDGQKRLGYFPSTVLLFTKSRAGEYALTTVKDRNRVELEAEGFENFLKDYMVKVAGWKMTKVAE